MAPEKKKPKPAKKPPGPWPKRLKELRARWGSDGVSMPQGKAAKKLGVSVRSWASWELGERTPTETVQHLINLLVDNPGLDLPPLK